MNTHAIQSEPPMLGTHNGFEVYPMPMFIAMETQDINALVTWYQNALGFAVMFQMPGNDGQPMMIHLRRSKYQDILVRRAPQDNPALATHGTSLCFQANGDVDQVAEHTASQPIVGQSKVEQTIDTPWNTRQVTLIDPDGRKLVFSHPRFDPELIKQMQAKFQADKRSSS